MPTHTGRGRWTRTGSPPVPPQVRAPPTGGEIKYNHPTAAVTVNEGAAKKRVAKRMTRTTTVRAAIADPGGARCIVREAGREQLRVANTRRVAAAAAVCMYRVVQDAARRPGRAVGSRGRTGRPTRSSSGTRVVWRGHKPARRVTRWQRAASCRLRTPPSPLTSGCRRCDLL